MVTARPQSPPHPAPPGGRGPGAHLHGNQLTYKVCTCPNGNGPTPVPSPPGTPRRAGSRSSSPRQPADVQGMSMSLVRAPPQCPPHLAPPGGWGPGAHLHGNQLTYKVWYLEYYTCISCFSLTWSRLSIASVNCLYCGDFACRNFDVTLLLIFVGNMSWFF